jgi:hypothetical protein
MCFLPRFGTLVPPFPEGRAVFFDHPDQCHIAGMAHETSDPVKPALIQCVAGCLFPHQGGTHCSIHTLQENKKRWGLKVSISSQGMSNN